MNIALLSDLHLERFNFQEAVKFIKSFDPVGVDILVLAGDILPIKMGTAFLELFAERYKSVVYVGGNHCWWGQSVEKTQKTLQSLSFPNFHYLENKAVEIDGQRFVGATLWFNQEEVERLRHNWRDWSDFITIQDSYPWIYEQNKATVEWFKNNIQVGDVVVSHHLPSYQCVAPQFKGSQYNCFFANDLDDLITRKKPKYWFFGHTHSSVDLTIGSTRLVANPYGYHGREVNEYFKENLTLKV